LLKHKVTSKARILLRNSGEKGDKVLKAVLKKRGMLLAAHEGNVCISSSYQLQIASTCCF
jgi:hypothetical protein